MTIPSYIDLDGDKKDIRPERYPNFSLSDYLKEQGIKYRERSADDHVEFSLNCPMCTERGCDSADTKQRLWINPKKGIFHCYRCHWDGTLIRLVEHYSSANYQVALRILGGSAPNALEHLAYKLFDEEFEEDEEEAVYKEVDLPFGFTPFDRTRNLFSEYLKSRGIPLSYAIEHGWGYTERGFYKNRIIVPSYVNDVIIHWQARDVLEDHHPDWGTEEYRKVRNPRGLSANKVLYNYDGAKECETVALCEGFVDACKIGEFAMATNGKFLHDAQIDLLMKTNAKTIVMCWDWDAYHDEAMKHGKLKPSSAKRAEKKLAAYFEVKHFAFPEDRDAGSYKYGVLGKRILRHAKR